MILADQIAPFGWRTIHSQGDELRMYERMAAHEAASPLCFASKSPMLFAACSRENLMADKFENVQQKQSLTGEGGNGNADASADSIYTIWPSDNHETTHILTYRIGYPTAFFNEGIAVANEVDPLDNSYTPMWHGTPVHECAKQLLAAGTLPALADIVETNAFWAADQNITYPAAGSFIEYLTEQYGLQKVLQLFPGASYQDSLAVASARF
jgi:hypothetical protein